MIKTPGAPACFASPSVYSMDSEICKNCIGYDQCGDASYETLEKIREVINVDDLMKRHRAAKAKALAVIAAADKKRVETMPPGSVQPPIPVAPVERKTLSIKVKFEPSEADNVTIMKMGNEKAKDIALRIVKAGDDEAIRQALAEGRNHFGASSGPAHVRVGITMLLEGGFTKKSFRLRLQSDLGWSEGTAGSHVGQACAILTALKCAQEKKGTFTLLPASGK